MTYASSTTTANPPANRMLRLEAENARLRSLVEGAADLTRDNVAVLSRASNAIVLWTTGVNDDVAKAVNGQIEDNNDWLNAAREAGVIPPKEEPAE